MRILFFCSSFSLTLFAAQPCSPEAHKASRQWVGKHFTPSFEIIITENECLEVGPTPFGSPQAKMHFRAEVTSKTIPGKTWRFESVYFATCESAPNRLEAGVCSAHYADFISPTPPKGEIAINAPGIVRTSPLLVRHYEKVIP